MLKIYIAITTTGTMLVSEISMLEVPRKTPCGNEELPPSIDD